MKQLQKFIQEGTEQQYRVSFIEATDKEGLPISATILINKNNVKEFEDFLNNSEGDIFAHAEGGNVEY